MKFCQKEKLKIKILSKSSFGGFSRQKWGKEKKKKNHHILIFGSHCLAKKKLLLKICTLFLVYSQIWLNIPFDDCHFFCIVQISGLCFFRIFALWRLNVFAKIRFSSVESKIFLIKRKKIHLETTKLEQKEKKKILLPMDDNHFRYKQKFLEKTLTTHKNF